MMKILGSGSISCLMIAALFILGSAQLAWAADQILSGSIKQMMSPEEFKAAGLDKLSSEELQKLDAWLQGYRETTEKTTEKRVEKKVASRSLLSFKMDTIVSRVDGSFGGLKGRTLIKL